MSLSWDSFLSLVILHFLKYKYFMFFYLTFELPYACIFYIETVYYNTLYLHLKFQIISFQIISYKQFCWCWLVFVTYLCLVRTIFQLFDVQWSWNEAVFLLHFQDLHHKPSILIVHVFFPPPLSTWYLAILITTVCLEVSRSCIHWNILLH